MVKLSVAARALLTDAGHDEHTFHALEALGDFLTQPARSRDNRVLLQALKSKETTDKEFKDKAQKIGMAFNEAKNKLYLASDRKAKAQRELDLAYQQKVESAKAVASKKEAKLAAATEEEERVAGMVSQYSLQTERLNLWKKQLAFYLEKHEAALPFALLPREEVRENLCVSFFENFCAF